MTETHPLVMNPPHAVLWKRSDRNAQAVRPSRHAELVVLCAVAGRASYVVDDRILPLQAGSVLFAWAGTAHFLVSDEPGFDMWVALVDDRFAAGVPGLPPVSGTHPAEARSVLSADLRELDYLATELRRARPPEAATPGLAWWLHRAFRMWTDAPAGKGNTLHPAVEKAAQLIRDMPGMPISEISRTVGLSSGRLGHLFRTQIGQGLVAFRTAEKLARVQVLVHRDGRDLLTAALDAGFGSYAQFYRACRKQYGVSPRDFFG